MLDVGILLQKTDIGAVLLRLGIQFEKRRSKRGYELYFACPSGKHPDDPLKKRCSISDDGKFKGLYNCWACGMNGNLVQLIEFLNNWDFKRAISFLEVEYGTPEVIGTEALAYRLKMNKEEDEQPEMPSFELPLDYKLLTKCTGVVAKTARDWLTNERHISEKMMDKYQIGLCNHDKIGFSIVIPVWFRGQIRSIFWAQPFKGGLKRYPSNSPQGRILFNYDVCAEDGDYVMMESILDVIKYDSVVGENAMACFTNMISDGQLELLRVFEQHGVMPDLDGHRGWDLVNRMVPMTGKGIWLYFCPIGKDPGDCSPEELFAARAERIRYCDYEVAQWVGSKNVSATKVTDIKKC